MNTAQWESIPAFPGYEVSTHGDVRRMGRVKAKTRDRKGYHKVTMWRSGKPSTRLVAPLVAAAFVGAKPEGQQVRHMDGDKAHNHFTNLEYGTQIENEHDKRRHGTAPIGENHPSAKLTPDQVSAIRKRYVKNSRTDGCNALGKDYGVTGVMIFRIISNIAWRHLA